MLLAAELEAEDSPNTGDEDFVMPQEKSSEIEDVIPPTPQKSKQYDKDEKYSPDESDDQDVQEHDDSDYEEEEDEDEEDDSYSDEDETWVSFYQKKKHANDELNQFLLMFCQHLQTLNGGHLKERHAVHNAQNVRKIVKHLDPGSKEIDCLFIEGGISVCKNWAQPMLDSKKMRPGMVKSYLCSLAKFFEFLVDAYETGLRGIPKIGKELKDKLPHMV